MRIVTETGKPIAQVAEDLGINETTLAGLGPGPAGLARPGLLVGGEPGPAGFGGASPAGTL
ncbi:hypothetical protein ABZ746_35975 [Streptomyces sp. NPDC020096]